MTGAAGQAIEVSGVSKKFARSLRRSFVYGARDLLGSAVGRRPAPALRESEFWAVRDVSFTLGAGESIGIVGANGSGKTTLLRMICGILAPDAGAVRVRGRVAPLLALGAGFKPVLSGRENVFLNMSLLGVSHRRIRALFDEVVAFAELEHAIDAPIGTYSSGMMARLGFACAVHTEPGILVVDEILSVGDAQFRAKCRNRINALRSAGTAMLLVSHSAISIETLCDRCLYLRNGAMVMLGTPAAALKAYEGDAIRNAAARNARRLPVREAAAVAVTGSAARTDPVRITGVDIAMARADGHWMSGRSGTLRVMLACDAPPVDQVSLNLMILGTEAGGGDVQQALMSVRDTGWLTLTQATAEVRLCLDPVGLRPATYRAKLSLSHGDRHDLLDVVDGIKLVVASPGGMTDCSYFQPRSWQFDGACAAGVDDGQLSETVEYAEDF